MRLVSTLVAVVFSLSLASFPVHAQGRGNGQGKKQTTQTTRTKIDTPKATGQSKQAAKAETRTVKAATKAERKAAKAETKAARAETKSARKATVGTTNVENNDVETTIRLNPNQEARLQKMLGDIPIQDALAGFKNKGQAIAAVHVSTNLGIPFADLKAKMTGITPGSTEKAAPMSLGQAIQAWKAEHPEGGTLTTTRVRNEVKRAEDAASADLR